MTLALGLLRQGVRVEVLERDLTAVRGEGKVRGPIQVRRAVRVCAHVCDMRSSM